MTSVHVGSNDSDNSPPISEPATAETSANWDVDYYREVIDAGVQELFEPRTAKCPMCAGNALIRVQTLRDYIQLKPGYFHMSRCESCGHIFQNPRLNMRGLQFYYRDFYTGGGEKVVERQLASTISYYRARARMIKQYLEPSRWLDIGAGYAHFCKTAREYFKETKFHVIDVSPTIQRAEQLGWAERAFAGAFIDVAAELKETYDVVSMFHYLEHTSDPLAELRAAASIVAPNGFLMIEVPDPDCVGRRWMGRWWPSWFAPQHLHLFPSHNMETYLREMGFEPILWHRAKAHQPNDAFFAMGNFMRQLVPAPALPWSAVHIQPFITRLLWIRLLWFPAKIVTMALDWLLIPLKYLPHWPNTYRVLARKRESGFTPSAS